MFRRNKTKADVMEYDFPSNVITRFEQDNPEFSASDVEMIKVAFLEYIAVIIDSPGVEMEMPSKALDKFWHNFILFTKDYHAFCDQYVGSYIHHSPHVYTDDSPYDRETAARKREMFTQRYRESMISRGRMTSRYDYHQMNRNNANNDMPAILWCALLLDGNTALAADIAPEPAIVEIDRSSELISSGSSDSGSVIEKSSCSSSNSHVSSCSSCSSSSSSGGGGGCGGGG